MPDDTARFSPVRTLAPPAARTPRTTDLHVGARIRLRRRATGQSQQSLAAAIDLTFQQVQKYERGLNRVSASMLVDIARAQGAPVAWYFEGLEEQIEGETTVDTIHAFLITSEGYRLAKAFPRLRPAHRKLVTTIAERLASDEAKLADDAEG